MKFCTKTQDLLKAYNKAINDLLIELLERSGWECITFYKYDEHRKLRGCESDEGTEFQAGDGFDDGITITGYWVGGDIGGILVVNEEWFIKSEILKKAVELKTTNIPFYEIDRIQDLITFEDVFDYCDYEYKETKKQRPVLNFENWYKLKNINK
jgi:hypothetical protein